MAFATQHVSIIVAKPEPVAQPVSPFKQLLLALFGPQIDALFGQWFEWGLQIMSAVLAGVGVSSLAFALGVPKFIGLCIGAAVVGLVLALLKDSDQGPTTA